VETPQRKYLALRDLDWRIVLGFYATITICLFFYRQLDYVANGEHRSPLLTFSEEGIGCLAGFIVFPLMYSVAIRFPLPSPQWRRNLLGHLVGVSLISLLHTTLIAALRAAIFPLLGFGKQGYGYLPVRYPMEFAHLFIFYWAGVSLVYLFHEIRFAREQELRQAHLETNLAEAQLQNLRLQLEPHFLFNALNAISTAIYENPRIADEMVGRLSELLRQLLRNDRSQEISLQREIELLELYTRIMEARLEDRLKISIVIDDAVKGALVPQLILQPLVENAIRHGMDAVTFKVDVTVQARREADCVAVSVRDHGPGLESPECLKNGIGLRNTSERLERLYGSEQSFAIHNAEGGGTIVEMRMPLR
jgi:two-component sensor histidine kinase